MKRIQSFKNFIIESLYEDNDSSDTELEKEIEDYKESKRDKCPRCGEYADDCQCNSSDYWSTQTYHRVPKGEYEKSKPKQKFKKE